MLCAQKARYNQQYDQISVSIIYITNCKKQVHVLVVLTVEDTLHRLRFWLEASFTASSVLSVTTTSCIPAMHSPPVNHSNCTSRKGLRFWKNDDKSQTAQTLEGKLSPDKKVGEGAGIIYLSHLRSKLSKHLFFTSKT